MPILAKGQKKKDAEIKFRIKEEDKERFKAYADDQGYTMTGLLEKWINESISKDREKTNQ